MILHYWHEQLLKRMGPGFRAGTIAAHIVIIYALLFLTGGFMLMLLATLVVFARLLAEPHWLLKFNRRLRQARPLHPYLAQRLKPMLARAWPEGRPRPQLMRVDAPDVQAYACATPLGAIIVLSDPALRSTSDDELEAMLAHECAHLIHGHPYLLWTVQSLLMLSLISATLWLARDSIGLFTDSLSIGERLTVAASLVALAPIAAGMDRILRRLMEWQADDYAVAVTGQPAALTAMLERQLAMQPGSREIATRIRRRQP